MSYEPEIGLFATVELLRSPQEQCCCRRAPAADFRVDGESFKDYLGYQLRVFDVPLGERIDLHLLEVGES